MAAALRWKDAVCEVGPGAVWVGALPWELHSHGDMSLGTDSGRHSTSDAQNYLSFLP